MLVQSDEIMFQSGHSQPDPTSALQSQSGSTPLVTDSYINRGPCELLSLSCKNQNLAFVFTLHLELYLQQKVLPLLLLVFHFNFRLVKNTLLVMIKSVVTVQKLTGSGLRLKLSQPILTNRSLKNFSTTRYGLKNDADGPDNKLREGVPFESFVKNSENLDHFTHSSRFMT